MAFAPEEVENGAGLATAIVYAKPASVDPVADAVAHLTRRGRTRFAAEITASQEAHLLRAVEYAEGLARDRIMGIPRNLDQGLLMPRQYIVVNGLLLPETEVPLLWLYAVWEAAELSASGQPLGHVVEDKVNVTKETTGRALTTEWSGAGATKARRYPWIYRLLTPFLREAGEVQRG